MEKYETVLACNTVQMKAETDPRNICVSNKLIGLPLFLLLGKSRIFAKCYLLEGYQIRSIHYVGQFVCMR